MSRTPIKFLIVGITFAIFAGLSLFVMIGPTIQIETVDATNDVIEIQQNHIEQLIKDKVRLEAEVELARPKDNTFWIVWGIVMSVLIIVGFSYHAISGFIEMKEKEIIANGYKKLYDCVSEELNLLKEKKRRKK